METKEQIIPNCPSTFAASRGTSELGRLADPARVASTKLT